MLYTVLGKSTGISYKLKCLQNTWGRTAKSNLATHLTLVFHFVHLQFHFCHNSLTEMRVYVYVCQRVPLGFQECGWIIIHSGIRKYAVADHFLSANSCQNLGRLCQMQKLVCLSGTVFRRMNGVYWPRMTVFKLIIADQECVSDTSSLIHPPVHTLPASVAAKPIVCFQELRFFI